MRTSPKLSSAALSLLAVTVLVFWFSACAKENNPLIRHRRKWTAAANRR